MGTPLQIMEKASLVRYPQPHPTEHQAATGYFREEDGTGLSWVGQLLQNKVTASGSHTVVRCSHKSPTSMSKKGQGKRRVLGRSEHAGSVLQ